MTKMPNPLVARNLSSLAGIRHGFFTREGGVSDGIYASLNCGLGSNDDKDRVLENRGRVAAALGARHGDVVTLYQVHGGHAQTVTAPTDRGVLPKADAVVSRTPGLAVGVLTADCTPVLFADAEAGVVAAAHAGWRGAVGGILEAAIAEMERQGAHRAAIQAAIGPSIGVQVYEVGPEFMAEFVALDRDNEQYFHFPAPGARAHFDLPGFVNGRLVRAGLAGIETVAPCTYGNELLFFSYRRSQGRKEGDYGRQISAIVVA